MPLWWTSVACCIPRIWYHAFHLHCMDGCLHVVGFCSVTRNVNVLKYTDTPFTES